MIGDDIAWLDNLQAHLVATKRAVMGRCRRPLTLFESLPTLVKAFLPTKQMRSDEDYDDDQQNNAA